ncbi:hypothetical protein KTAU_13840 [Thermogemmatispora aurantia]|uniref:Uncharacterized protein n=1 Tax=Thermogemmatispora aurantia TaxID=2045279 RepID=A0A5J4K7W1_9CHLR|nr:hypothetical protein [Thermogemmatispora aurantia]GER82747.1 hypothetical protein KTAU_13840 [Thermogemmatispora aurantia]
MELTQFEGVLQQCAAEEWWPEEMGAEVMMLAIWGLQEVMVMTGDLVEGMWVVDWIGFAARAERLAQLCQRCGRGRWAERLQRLSREALEQYGKLLEEFGQMERRARQRSRGESN